MKKDLKNLFNDLTGLDGKSLASLTKALEKNDLPGFDYLEYKQSLQALSAMQMEETTAFKSAFATAATVGLTKEKLLKSIDHYLKVLNTEKGQFDQALQKQLDQRVKGKRAEVEKLKGMITEYQSKIVELEKKIAKSQQTIDQADAHIQSTMEKIEATQQNFERTLASIVSQITEDKDRINNYL